MAIERRFGSGLRVAAVVALLLPLAGCGSDTARPPLTVVTPQPVRAVLTDPPVVISEFESGEWSGFSFPVSSAGVLDITVDWTFPESWIYVYFGETACDYQQLAGGKCPFVISSETPTPKPRVLTTSPVQPGTYYMVFYNVPWDVKTRTGSDNMETLQVRIGLTVSASGERVPVPLGRPSVVPQPGR